jgi:hypothetical protein
LIPEARGSTMLTHTRSSPATAVTPLAVTVTGEVLARLLVAPVDVTGGLVAWRPDRQTAKHVQFDPAPAPTLPNV